MWIYGIRRFTYTLQENTSLSTTNWVNQTNGVSIVSTNCRLACPPANGARFFRLIHP